MKNFSETLNLPKTDFSMRADLITKEPKFLAEWEEKKLYSQVRNHKNGAKKFIFHDGPPYANGDIHMGHALNKILKDIVTKYKTLRGFDVPYTPGWDTHGMPIEHKVIEQLGPEAKKVSKAELRKKCRDYALKFVDIQRNQMKRLGIICDWDNPYLTLSPEFEARELEVFKELVKNGYVFKGLKPILWCKSCETALAEAEIEYDDHRSPSIYVKFKSESDLSEAFDVSVDKPAYFVIWTTTPWTLPANLAICLNETYSYSLIEYNGEYLVMCSDLAEAAMKDINPEAQYKTVATCTGKDLELKRYTHAFLNKSLPVILGDHVTLEAGTGCVHTAPGHGQEDYIVGHKYNIGMVSPVDPEGKFAADCEFEIIRGKTVEESNKIIGEHLEKSGHLLKLSFVKHSYPHCWRCKNALIFRATEQWFISVEKSDLRQKCLDLIKDVTWVPAWGENRITAMMELRPDWCITRQRCWGVPLPILYCKTCGKEVVEPEIIDRIIEKVRQVGTDIWFEKEAHEIIGEYTCKSCGAKEFRKETDIFDVWFDSGTSHWAVLKSYPGLEWPSELYLEGSDQHRGWFQTSLLTSAAAFGTAPYKTVLTHGFIVDGDGKKMSKSIGNTIAPLEIINKYGADILRLWVASTDYKEDIRISENIIKQIAEAYKKLRNTIRYLMGNLNGFDPKQHTVAYENLTELDKWALSRFNRLVKQFTEYYDRYEFYKITHALINFCTVDMSAFYLDVIKDRLYCDDSEGIRRRGAQTVMHEILTKLISMMAPILSFTAEEVWQQLAAEVKSSDTVFLAQWPQADEQAIDNALEEKWEKMFAVRTEIQKCIERKRAQKIVGHSLDCKVTVRSENAELLSFIKDFPVNFQDLLIVSRFSAESGALTEGFETGDEMKDLFIKAEKINGSKCERCWMYAESVEEMGERKICSRCKAVVEKEYADFFGVADEQC